MLTYRADEETEIRKSFESPAVANRAIELVRDPEALRDFNVSLFTHMGMQLFYNQKEGYARPFDPGRIVDIFGDPKPAGSIMVAARILIENFGIDFYRDVTERLQERTVKTSAFNFPTTQLAAAMTNEQVMEGAANAKLEMARGAAQIQELFLAMSNMLAALVIQGEELNVNGFTGVKKQFPEGTTPEDMIKLIHLALVTQAREMVSL